MKIYLDKFDLNNALNIVSYSQPLITSSEILNGILIEIKNKKMFFTTTDTNITIETFINVKTEEEASFVIISNKFSQIAKTLPSEKIEIEYNEEKEELTLKSGHSVSVHRTLKGEEFPKIKIKEEEKIILEKEDFKKSINRTAFAASQDKMTGVMTNVLMEIEEKNLRMVATDGFRLAINNLKIDYEGEKEILIPSKSLIQVSKIIREETENKNLELGFNDNKVILKFDKIKVVMNTYNGLYVDYERIIDRTIGIENSIEFIIERAELEDCINRASIFSAQKKNNLIIWTIENEMLSIESMSEEGSVEEIIDMNKINGGKKRIGFNANSIELKIGFNAYLIKEIIRNIGDDEIKISMKNSERPALIIPLKGKEYFYLILPVRI